MFIKVNFEIFRRNWS